MLRSVRILLWRTLALTALLLALIGVALPIMPTVPFLLLAAWAAGKGWPRLETWLLNHRLYGHPIKQWRQFGAVPRPAKYFASIAMLGSTLMLLFAPLPDDMAWVRWAVPLGFVAVLIWLWRRPEL